MHGRIPRLPIEVQLGIPDVTDKMTTTSYVRRLQEHLSKAFEIARDCSGAAAGKSKLNYNRKTRFNRLEIGDLVMVKVNAFGRDHKIADRWEQVLHKVIKILGHSVAKQVTAGHCCLIIAVDGTTFCYKGGGSVVSNTVFCVRFIFTLFFLYFFEKCISRFSSCYCCLLLPLFS